MNRRLELLSIALFALNAGVVGGITSSLADETGVEVGIDDLRGEILSLFAPSGAVATETNPNYKGAAAPAPAAPPPPAVADWPSYNKTLTSERFSDLSQINTKNVAKLKVLCTYDTWRLTAFETGLIMVEGALIGTTEFDIFSINPSTCAENWRTHEEYPAYILPTNRGAAYLDGMLFRGTDDGRALAYDFKTGKRLWETRIADPTKGESVPAAPIAWQGLVFIGNAGGDFKGGKGRVYALDAKTGKIVWEFYLVPKVEGDPVRGPEGASPLDTSTWKNIPGAPISGGGAWTSTTLDPASALLYVPVGNPAPDFDNSVRQGDNLFTGSVVFGAVTPTAGGLVFFGDMGGNFYALDAATGQKLWGQKIGGAIGGGVITYTVNGAQKVAVATGYVSPAVPAEISRAKIAILGLEGD